MLDALGYVNLIPYPAGNQLPVNLGRIIAQAYLVCALGLAQEVGRIDQHLGGDAAPGQAGAAKLALLHHGHNLPGLRRGLGEHQPGPRPDYHPIKHVLPLKKK